MEFFFGYNEWHSERQWMLKAWDFGKNANRIFAMKDITFWRPFE